MTNPIPFKAEVSGSLEEAPSGAIPASLYGDVGGGGEGGPIHLDETDWVIARGESEVLPGVVVPIEVFLTDSGEIKFRMNIGTPEEPNWADIPSPYVPTRPPYDEGFEANYYRGVTEESVFGTPTLYKTGVRIESDVTGLGRFTAQVRNRPTEDKDHWSRLYLSTSRASLTTSLAEGSLPPGESSQRYTVTIETGVTGGIYAHDHPSNAAPIPDRHPYIGDHEASIITLAALRKYVEDTIGYGEPGQVLATNSTGDGYEWVTAPSGT